MRRATKAEVEKEAERLLQERLDVVRDVMQSAEGRRFVWRMLELSNPLSNPAVVSQGASQTSGDYSYSERLDPVQATFYNLGKQHVGRVLYTDLQRPELIDLFRVMQEEASEN